VSIEDDDLDQVMQPDEAFHLEAFKGERNLDLENFSKLHGRAFLLMQRAAGGERLHPPARPSRTLLTEEPDERTDLPPSKYLVFPVRKTERSLIARFYSVGQTRNNDIVIRDVSVSKSHAFFEDDGSGGFTLQDARSTNGTYVNGKRVPRSGMGLPAVVKTGDLVRFGTVELSFIDVRSFRDLIRATLK
jgi:hypothetical protein